MHSARGHQNECHRVQGFIIVSEYGCIEHRYDSKFIAYKNWKLYGDITYSLNNVYISFPWYIHKGRKYAIEANKLD